jgi:hypothetical protein
MAGPRVDLMSFVRTRISVSGFSEQEARNGLPHLFDEFSHRPYLLKPDAYWDEPRQRLVVIVAYEGDDPRIEGGVGGALFDIVWDCVIACLDFTSDGIHFDIEESVVLLNL